MVLKARQGCDDIEVGAGAARTETLELFRRVRCR